MNQKIHPLTLPAIALSLMTVISAVAGLNVALPSIARDLGATQTQLTWVVDAYTVVFAGLLLISGALSDRFGRKNGLVFGLVIYLIVSTYGLFAHSVDHLIALRAVMGIGAAFIMPSTLSVITTSFPPEDRSRAVGVWVGVAGGGAFIGLFGSAFLMRYYSWHSFFALNLVLALLGLIGAIAVVPNSADKTGKKLDVAGGLISILLVGGLVYGIIEGAEFGWSSLQSMAGFAVFACAFPTFILVELKREAPLLDPRLFKNRGFTMGSLSITLQFFGQFGFIFVGLQFLQFIYGFTPWQAVLKLLLVPFIVLPMSRVAGVLSKRIPQKYLGSFGLAILAIGMYVFSTMPLTFSYTHFWSGLALFAFGMALASTPATTAITNSLPAEKQGVASAVNDVSRELGSALGIALVGAILNSAYRSGMADAVKQLPTKLAEQVTHSIAFTSVNPPAGMEKQFLALKAKAFESFQHGTAMSMRMIMLVAIIAAITIFVFAPKSIHEVEI
ncbi:MAG: MFS transporter [Actinobacteria bacterium]|nr:MFS transporter [Actinomycetota bacterium]